LMNSRGFTNIKGIEWIDESIIKPSIQNVFIV
jgi:hypothetical protein